MGFGHDSCGREKNPEVNWADIDAPRLGIFDQPSVQGRLPYYWYLSAEDQKKFDNNWPGIVQWFADTTAKFDSHTRASRLRSSIYCPMLRTIST